MDNLWIWLVDVGGMFLPRWKVWKSIGRITDGKIENVPNHQPATCEFGFWPIPKSMAFRVRIVPSSNFCEARNRGKHIGKWWHYRKARRTPIGKCKTIWRNWWLFGWFWHTWWIHQTNMRLIKKKMVCFNPVCSMVLEYLSQHRNHINDPVL